MREHSVSRPHGRTLRVREDGDPEGDPVFSFHGTPGCRFLYSKHVADARARGVRLIGYDRPGYGGSTALPGRRVADVAGDVEAIADALHLERFAVWGHSGGGPPALACAALLPDRVVAASSLAGEAPPGAAGLDFTAGMGEANREDYALMMSDRAAWERKVEEESAVIAHGTAEQLLALYRTLLSDVDRGALTPELVAFLIAQGGEGLGHGGAGMRDDNLSSVTPWGFELTSVRVPLQLWHGAHDQMVPFAHGQWLAARLEHAEVHLEADEGHLSLYERRIPEVHEWLASKF